MLSAAESKEEHEELAEMAARTAALGAARAAEVQRRAQAHPCNNCSRPRMWDAHVRTACRHWLCSECHDCGP